MKPTLLKSIGSALFVVIAVSCSGPKKVIFEEDVDTSDQPILFQTKKTYHLQDANVWLSNEFDAARLNYAQQVNDSVIRLSIFPENTPINKSPYYAFKVWSGASTTMYFEFEYPEGFKHRYIPKIKTGEQWTKVDASDFHTTETGALLKMNIEKEPKIVAAQEINSTSDVQKWYSENILKGNEAFIKEFSAGKSVLGRNLPVLDITYGSTKNKPLVVLMTRQHPPEVTGYFAYQHFLETIVEKNELSKAFLSKYRVLAFPILNPDGVDMGHWRHNSHGVDLNRDWSKYRQTEVKNVVSYITKTSKKDHNTIVLGLDFHSTYEDVFYTNQRRKGTTLPNFVKDWFAALEKNIEGYKVNEAAGNSTKPVSKGWFLYGRNATGITYEIGDDTPKDRIEEIGKKSARAMMEILLDEHL